MQRLLTRVKRRLRPLVRPMREEPVAPPLVELLPEEPVEEVAEEVQDALPQELAEALAAVEGSELFDLDYYLDVNPDVLGSGVNPHLHYLTCGWIEGRRPSVGFDPAAYVAAHPDVAAAGMEPLTHYILSGEAEGRILEPRETVRSSSVTSLKAEALRGRAFLRRFGISARSDIPLGEGVALAVDDLIARDPALTRERLEPEVSIIIPVYGQLPFVLNTLDSLAGHASRHSAEIILLDDASPAEMQTGRLGAIPWIRYVRPEANTGFIGACNRAAELARGRFLIFLNSDTRVSANWLDELIGSFSLFPRAGLVGSKLLNEDMTLQEAGGLFWRDGSAWNYGRDADPDNPKYSFARRVDYCSGCAIAVPATAWREMGGFDTAFAPAYYEDADLAFRLREAGYEVWMQPLALVLHYEGRTHGRDTSTGVKAYQVTNFERFAERWKKVLISHRENGVFPDAEANRHARERLLVLDATTLTPDRDAGSFIAMRTLRVLRGLGYQLAFVPQHNYIHAGAYTEALQREGVECLYAPFVRHFPDVLTFHGGFDVVLGYRFNVLGEVYAQIRRHMPQTRVMFNNVDLHYLRQEREAALLGSRPGRIAAMVTKAEELELIAQVDCTIVHTPTESAIIRREVPISNIIEIPWIAELSPTKAPFAERHDILFLGGFAHQPNVDAVEHFVEHIWPRVLPHLPDTARLVVAGASPPPSIRALAGERIKVTGYLEDLHASFEAARVFIAPLRYGAGIKGKVIESMRRGTPAVVSPIAAEGMGLRDRHEVIIAEVGEGFADEIVALYGDKGLWEHVQGSGYAFVDANFSVERNAQLLRNALDIADDTWIERRQRALRQRLVELCGVEDGADGPVAS